MTGVTEIADTGVQDAINALIAGIGGQIGLANTATAAVASAILPPGMESASWTANTQELGNVYHYEAMLSLGVLEVQKANGVISANNHAMQVADLVGSAVLGSISPV